MIGFFLAIGLMGWVLSVALLVADGIRRRRQAQQAEEFRQFSRELLALTPKAPFVFDEVQRLITNTTHKEVIH